MWIRWFLGGVTGSIQVGLALLVWGLAILVWRYVFQ